MFYTSRKLTNIKKIPKIVYNEKYVVFYYMSHRVIFGFSITVFKILHTYKCLNEKRVYKMETRLIKLHKTCEWNIISTRTKIWWVF